MKLLITGGAGFIGNCFIRHILNKYPNYKVTNLDLLTYAGNLTNLKDVVFNSNYNFIKGNICDENTVSEHIKNVDCCINFAAESHVDNSINSSKEFINTNVLGTQVLLDCAKKFNIPRFIQISTDEVYGTLSETGYFYEDTPLAPNSPYSASKAAADLLVRSYFETHKMPAIITRCSNNYGPYQHPEKLIPLTITNLLNNKSIPVYGNGLNVRDWLYVYDHCEAIDLVLHKGKEGEVYNIGGNNEKTNIDLVKSLVHSINKSETLIKYVDDRPGHDKRYAIDSTKIRDELGWKPKTKFDDGIKHTINWYKNNQQWIESCKQHHSSLITA